MYGKYRLNAEERDCTTAVESVDMQEAQKTVNRKMRMKGFRVAGKMKFKADTFLRYDRFDKV